MSDIVGDQFMSYARTMHFGGLRKRARSEREDTSTPADDSEYQLLVEAKERVLSFLDM